MSKNKFKKKFTTRKKAEQNRPAKGNHDLSLPSGKDESHLVTVVREQWDSYKAQEKRFSKAFALALIALHKQLAKPGHGSFVEKLHELRIPTSTAYRLMRLHDWQPDKQTSMSDFLVTPSGQIHRSSVTVAPEIHSQAESCLVYGRR